MDDDHIFDSPMGQEVLRRVKRKLRAELEEQNQQREETRKAKVQPIRPDIIPQDIENFKFDAKSLGEIQDTEYPPIRWIVPKIMPEGLTILSGPPKIGKSWVSMNLALAVGGGGIAFGNIPVTQGKVLYLALEDSERRISERTQRILEHLENVPENIRNNVFFATMSARLDNGLLDAIHNFVKDHPDTALILIDTLAKIRPSKRTAGRNAYENDYADLCALQTLCSQQQVSITVITHNRKQNAEDVLEDISGSMGISGSGDTILVMKRQRGTKEATLYVTGRDVIEETYSMLFDDRMMSWCITDQGATVGLSEEANDVLDILREHGGNGKSTIEIARLICGDHIRANAKDPDYEKIRKRLEKLERENIIDRVGKFFFYRPK